MPGETRVPKKDSEFDQYIRNTYTVLSSGTPTGAVRLGLSTAQFDQWEDYHNDWLIIYPKYTDPAQRTRTITEDKNLLKKNFTTFAENPLKLIEASANLTTDDRATFRLPARDRNPTARGPIEDIPVLSLKAKGGGKMQIRVRREDDGNRASMHPLASAILLKYAVVDSLAGNPPAPGEPDTGPSPDEMPNSATSTSALWTLDLGNNARGKTIVAFARWLNLTRPENSSGWSNISACLIS